MKQSDKLVLLQTRMSVILVTRISVLLKTGMFVILFLIFLHGICFSQGGMKFEELAKKIEPYFADDLISDLKKQLPQGSNYSIWGWDVGDYSGDGSNDIVFTVKVAAEKKKICQVYFFVDLDGFLTKVTQMPIEYVELPLEIGVVIKNNICYVTKKRKQFDWQILGFQFRNGNFIKLDEYSTNRIDEFTHESYTNYTTLQNTERYIKTIKGDERFKKSYLTIPSYQRGRLIYTGYSYEPYCNYVDYVSKGAFYWQGDSDASYRISSAYDNEFLYLTINVKDDQIVTQSCDTCICDYLELWFDTSPPPNDENAFIKSRGKSSKEKNKEKGIFCFKIYPGDFQEKKAFVKDISTTDYLYKFQKEATNWIKAVSSLQSDGYTIKCKIPFILFGFDGPPIDEQKYVTLGFTVVLHDIDNEFRPEEETQIATSLFEPSNPATYGTLILVPQDKWYGETMNIYRDDILKNLTELGF